MKKNLPILISIMLLAVITQAQNIILDFESTETSTTFQYFGSTLDGTLNATVPNPNPSGENTSTTVVWAGAFSNPNPTTPVDLTDHTLVAIKVYMDHIGSLSLKLENSSNGGSNWIITVPNTKVNEWETLIFDTSIPSIEAPNTPAAGYIYPTVTLFFDFGTPGTGTDVLNFFDDVVTLPPPPVITTILDFEAPETSTTFQYFGSTLDGTLTNIVANPDASGINTSTNVTEFIKPAVAEVWAGAFSNPNPPTPVTLETGSQVCINVWMDHIGNLALKLENGSAPNWINTLPNTTTNQWEQLCFDVSAPSIEAPFEPATGTYNTVTLFFDFGTGGTGTDVVNYFDDVIVLSTGAPEPKPVRFSVDMNSYTENFDQVYVSGTFNNWSGDANPLSDPDFDGVWEGELMLLNGTYEYKVTLDNWNAQEAFLGFEECTKRDPSGQFVNRLLLVSGETDLPTFCFNSCYACGQEVQLTFRLGFGDVEPSPDGVWLAGGGNFDVPGGKFQMQDNDGDDVYEITMPRSLGFGSFYTFTNGNCPDYSCKENLAGLPCGDPNNFNDRTLLPLEESTTIETCFGTCAEDVKCTVSTTTLQKDDRLFTLEGNPPVNEQTRIQFGSTSLSTKYVSLQNSIGVVLQQWTFDEGIVSEIISTAGLPSGMYLITVRTGDRYYTRKLIK